MVADAIEDEVKLIGKGVALFWKQYEFETGEKKDSRFLILSDCQYGCFLAIRATTKTEYYEQPSKLVREFVIVPERTEISFPKKSAIDFSKIRFLDVRTIKAVWKQRVTTIEPVSDNLLDEIDSIISGSKIVRKDWKAWILKSMRMNKES
jgi:hypothetical protein